MHAKVKVIAMNCEIMNVGGWFQILSVYKREEMHASNFIICSMK